jgi:beta-fructofuranosidase
MSNRRDFLKQSAIVAASTLSTMTMGRDAFADISPSLIAHVAADPQRPRYHFLPPANWMNDPNGPIYWQGYYHLFYQYNPNGAYWGDMHWGHASSPDLVHWTHSPVALAPTPGGPDEDGCFSGSAVDHRGTPTLVYTGVNPEVQCLASSDDAMIRWRKFKGNPVISSPPQDYAATGFRDPSIWPEGMDWLMSIGSGVKGRGGSVLLYRSKDFIHWDYIHELAAGPAFRPVPAAPDAKYDAVAAGDMWECPDFSALGRAHALLVSTQGQVHAMTGEYADRKFYARWRGKADYGDFYYAAKSFAASRGRRILWGWIHEGRSAAAQRVAGWAGVMSLPRVMSVNEVGTLRMEAASELKVLREQSTRLDNLKVRGQLALSGVRGDQLELRAAILPETADACGLVVRHSPGSEEETVISLLPGSRRLTVDTRRSSLDLTTARGVYAAPLEIRPRVPVDLSIFLDRSVIEVAADSKVWLTARIYPTRNDSLGMSAFANGGSSTVKSLEAYTMRDIWAK